MRPGTMIGAALLGALLVSSLAPASGAGAEARPTDDHARFRSAMDPAVMERLASGERVSLAEVGIPFEVAAPYTKIRPGSPEMNSLWPNGVVPFQCTLNFVFAQGERLAIGSAGHCHSPVHGRGGVGERVSTFVVDPDTLTVGVVEFGTVILEANTGGSADTDFALIEVDVEDRALVHPAIAELDGPCGFREAVPLELVQFYGHNMYPYAPGGQPRTGLVLESSATHVTFFPVHGAAGGDSGSPVRFLGSVDDLDLTAAGIVIGLQIGVLGQAAVVALAMPQVFQVIETADLGVWEVVDSPNCAALGGHPD